MSMKDLLRIDTSASSETIALKALLWVTLLSVVVWMIAGLVSLRFELEGSYEKVLYSQFIITGIVLTGVINAFVMSKGGFGARRAKIFGYVPVLWTAVVSASLIMLLWQVWEEFRDANELLKVMYSLLGIGLCGTYAGLVTLARVDRAYVLLQPVMYVLTLIVGVEILDGMWLANERISAASTGENFAIVGMAVGINMAGYAVLATILARFLFAYRGISLGAFATAALLGFVVTLVTLLTSLDAGPYRFILGACVLLSSASVALGMLHYFHVSDARAALRANPKTADEEVGNHYPPPMTEAPSGG